MVNLGAGFEHSWWDKDEVPLSGSDFLLETQARAHGQDYLKVQRAQWISRIIGEVAYNGRKGITGGFWSSMAYYQAVAIAATAVGLGPLGQELGEANELAATKAVAVEKATVTEADKKAVVAPNGVITVPVAACTGSVQPMMSFLGGLQAFCGGEFSCTVEVPKPGAYRLTARVVTVHDAGKLQLTANNAKDTITMVIPYTIGLWQKTEPVEVTLVQGKNTLRFSKTTNSFSLKEFTLTPAK